MKSLKFYARFAVVMLVCVLIVYVDSDLIKTHFHSGWGLLSGLSIGIAYAFGRIDHEVAQ